MVQKLRNLTEKYAILSAVAIAIIFYAIMQGVTFIFSILPSSTGMDYLRHIVGILYPIGIVYLFGFSSAFKAGGFKKTLICGMLMLVLQLISLINSIVEKASSNETAWQPWYIVILGVVTVISIGIREECIFRATIQGVLAKKYASSRKGILLTALLSAIIFGLIHALNVFKGVEPLSALVQAVTNIGIGMFWAAIYLRCGNMWALALIHAITDASGLFNALFCKNVSTAEAISSLSMGSLISGAVFFLIGLYMLRPSKCKGIIERFSPEPEVQSADAAT